MGYEWDSVRACMCSFSQSKYLATASGWISEVGCVSLS